MPSSHPRIFLIAILLGAGFIAGYLITEGWWGTRDRTPLAQICARVDYVNSLQEEIPAERQSSEEMRNQFAMLVEQCRAAMRGRAEQND